MPVTHGVAGSSPVQTAKAQKFFSELFLFYIINDKSPATDSVRKINNYKQYLNIEPILCLSYTSITRFSIICLDYRFFRQTS